VKHLVPSLSILALVGLSASALSAATISPKEETLTVGINGLLQTRLTLLPSGTYNNTDAAGNAQNGYNQAAPTTAPDGASYDPIRGTVGEPEKAHFDMRRVRLGVVGTYKDGWRGTIVLSADTVDSSYYGTARNPAIYTAAVGKKTTVGGLDHDVIVGLDKPYTAESSVAGNSYLFPTNRPGGDFVDVIRGVGAHYRLYGSMFTVAASFMNGMTTGAAGNNSNGVGEEGTPGYYGNLRAEFAPGASMMPKKKQESYVGAEGTHVVIGAEVDKEWSRQVAGYTGQGTGVWNDQDMLIWGPDVLVHFNGLSAIAEYKRRVTSWEATADWAGQPDPDSRNSQVWNLQAGYAMPLSGGMVVEPAARYADIDMDTHADEYGNYSRGVDYTAWKNITPSANLNGGARTGTSADLSGRQIEIGVNLYINGLANKLQLSYLNWQAEEGVGDAQMLILQHQLTF